MPLPCFIKYLIAIDTGLIQTLIATPGSTSSTHAPETDPESETDSPDMASYWDSILEMDPIEIDATK